MPSIRCIAISALLLGLGCSSPVPQASSITTITPSILLAIAPSSASCSTSSAFPTECRTAYQAADPINTSFSDFNITTNGEMAALISLMAYETANFVYQKNHFPGRPGQGTRNMQMPNFNLLYIQPMLDAATVAAMSPSQILDFLNSDDYLDFGSAAWFLTSQCSQPVRAGLQSGTEAGWEAYLTSCVGTTATDDRKQLWNLATAALGS